jgi:hypothetical protein
MELKKGELKLLNDTWHTIGEPGAYASANTLWRTIGKAIPFKKVQKYVLSQDIQSKYGKKYTTFKRRRIICKTPFDLGSTDITFLSDVYLPFNDDYKAILILIDCFSKICHCEPLKTKSAEEVSVAFEKCLGRFPKTFALLRSDRGLEYRNQQFAALMKKKHIKHYYALTKKASGAAIAERMARTLKDLLYKAMEDNKTYRWLDLLQPSLASYNGRPHSSTGFSPHDSAKPKNLISVRKHLLGTAGRYKEIKNPHFTLEINIGDWVRITAQRGYFARKDLSKFTLEKFQVRDIDRTITPTIYKLSDYRGLPVPSVFYRQELYPTSPDDPNQEYKIIVLKTNQQKSFVHYSGYDKKYDSWIATSEIQDISNLGR